jgi:hypothetical protein
MTYGLPDSFILGTGKVLVAEIRKAPRDKIHRDITNSMMESYANRLAEKPERVAKRNSFRWNIARGLWYYFARFFLYRKPLVRTAEPEPTKKVSFTIVDD